jgi:hypothetical protein
LGCNLHTAPSTSRMYRPHRIERSDWSI